MKKKLIIVGILVLVTAIAVAAIVLPPTWSKRSFEAVVEKTITQPNGEVRLIVKRTTEIYADPRNALHISEDTVLIGVDGEPISIEDIKPGYSVKVALADSFVEEIPFYYPTVFEVKVLSTTTY